MSRPLRPLPIRSAPTHGEAIGSYLHRLADANRLRMPTLSTLLIDRVGIGGATQTTVRIGREMPPIGSPH